jgi:serine/threonine protein kinase
MAPTILSDYQCLEVVGKGSFGRVEKCKDKYDDIVAIKFMEIRMEGAFNQEVGVLKRLPKSAFLPVYISSFTAKGYHVVISEFIEGHHFAYYMTKMTYGLLNVPKPDIMLRLMKTAYTGLSTLHTHNIVHRDIKVDNIMIRGARISGGELVLDLRDPRSGAVLIDVGLSCSTKLYQTDTCLIGFAGAPLFQHPELVQRSITGTDVTEIIEKVMKKADTWALMYAFLGLSVHAYPLPFGNKIDTSDSDPFIIISKHVTKWIKSNQNNQSEYYFYKKDSAIDDEMKMVILQTKLRIKSSSVLDRIKLSKSTSSGSRRFPGMTNWVDVAAVIKDIDRLIKGAVVGGVIIIGGNKIRKAFKDNKKRKQAREITRAKAANARAKAKAAKARAKAKAAKARAKASRASKK